MIHDAVEKEGSWPDQSRDGRREVSVPSARPSRKKPLGKPIVRSSMIPSLGRGIDDCSRKPPELFPANFVGSQGLEVPDAGAVEEAGDDAILTDLEDGSETAGDECGGGAGP